LAVIGKKEGKVFLLQPGSLLDAAQGKEEKTKGLKSRKEQKKRLSFLQGGELGVSIGKGGERKEV